MTAEVCVIGAGIIGITSALELQQRGIDVVLVDRSDPGMATTCGNAGVLSASTVLNVNNPGLFRKLPKLAMREMPYFEYDFSYAVSRVGWLLRFLANALPVHAMPTARALHSLQRISIETHRHLIARAGVDDILAERGWLKVYRDAKGYGTSSRERRLMRKLGIGFEELSSDDVRRIEPALCVRYEHGLLLTEACSISSPHALALAYLGLFERQGGRFCKFDVTSLDNRNGWRVVGVDGVELSAENVVLACGPWAPELCGYLGYRVPMAWERGYGVQLESPDVQLRRPVLESQHGFVMAPQGRTTRISSGVEFAHRDAPPNNSQILRALDVARKCAGFGAQVDGDPWLGARPTLPDGLPVIGAASRHDKLWLNFGHQHIGMSTSTGSAAVLADLLTGRSSTCVNADSYAPTRYGL